MTRLLGIDLGERRIGLAIADRTAGATTALDAPPRPRTLDADAAALAAIVAAQGVDELVVGLPLDASGDEGAAGRDHPGVGGGDAEPLIGRVR